jgi:hypothetical protein
MSRPAQSRAWSARRTLLKQLGAGGLSLLVPGAVVSRTTPRSPLAASVQFKQGAVRLDLRHNFVEGVENFSLERLRIEPNWKHERSRRAALPDWGDYRYSVYDASDNTLLYRAGFDSMSAPRAGSSTTEVSVRIPMPRRTVLAAIDRRRGDNVFLRRWAQPITVETDRIDRADEGIQLRVDEIVPSSAAQTVDVAILGDGYQDREYDKFIRDAARAARYLFSVEPFKKRQHDFNVRAVFAASVDSGVTDRYLGSRKNTVLGCTYDSGEAERTLAARNNRVLRDAASAVPYDFLLVLANARRYGGSAIFGGAAVVAIDSTAAPYLVLHEFAHLIGGLADEYYVPVAGGPSFIGNVEPWQPNVTISPASDKWPHRAQHPPRRSTAWNKSEYESYFSSYVRRYFALRSAHADEQVVEKLMHQSAQRGAVLLAKNIDRRHVGFFEGANGYARGVFRSEVDCIMFSYQTQYFCRACTLAIERMIDAHC